MASVSPEHMNDSLISSDDNRRMFNRIAGSYDLANRLISFGLDTHWRRRAVRLLAPSDNGRYLDLGCGTGDVILEILHQSPRSHVVGLDPAENMLEIARTRIDKANVCEQVSLVAGDALSLQFEDSSFAGIISAFCIRNISDRQKALAEMYRTLSPGSPLVLLELTSPRGGPLRLAYAFYSRYVIPLIGGLAGDREAYKYLIQSIDDFTRNGALEDLMKDAGFNNVKAVRMTCGTVTIFYGQRAQ